METSTKDRFEYLRYLSDTTDRKTILCDLMTAYGDDVWNFAFSICRRVDLAQDITQDVFLKVYRNLDTFRGESSVKTWLLSITRNTALDYKRSALLRKVTLVEWVPVRGSGRSAEAEVIERMAVNDIWKKVLKLPAKYREVLILAAHYQLSMKEIANILGIREGTVKSRLHHARLKVLKMKEREAIETT